MFGSYEEIKIPLFSREVNGSILEDLDGYPLGIEVGR